MRRDLDKRLSSETATKKDAWSTRKSKAHPKVAERAAQVRRRPWRIVAVLAVVLALVGGVVYLFGWSQAFVVKDVTVAGATGEVAQSVEERAAIPAGRPMARVNTTVVEEQVLTDLRVASVDVGRSWPSTVTLEVTLRQPALAINQSGTKGLQLADAQGVVYDTVEEAPEDVATVRAPKGELSAESLQAALAVPVALPPSVAKDMEGLTLTEAGVLEFTVGNIEVTWGDGSDATLKGRVLEGLLEQEGLDPQAEVDPVEGPMTIDLSSAETPIVTGLQTAAPTG